MNQFSKAWEFFEAYPTFYVPSEIKYHCFFWKTSSVIHSHNNNKPIAVYRGAIVFKVCCIENITAHSHSAENNNKNMYNNNSDNYNNNNK